MNKEAYLETIYNSDLNNRDKSLLYVIVHCGPKIKELQSITSENIESDKTGFTVHFPKRSVRVEDMKARFTIINWAATANMKMFGTPLFSSMRKNQDITGKPMSDVSINKILQATFPDTNVRQFRRMFIDEVISQPILKKEMKQQTGISSYPALHHYINDLKCPET